MFVLVLWVILGLLLVLYLVMVVVVVFVMWCGKVDSVIDGMLGIMVLWFVCGIENYIEDMLCSMFEFIYIGLVELLFCV